MARQKPFVIRTPFPTQRQMRKELGLSRRDVEKITKTVNEVLSKNKKSKKK